jgi:hypothetical protein
MWTETFMPWFARAGYPGYALSLRGHGGSHERERIDWLSVDDYVRDVRTAAEWIGTPPVLSSFTQTSTGVNGSPTLLKRELSTSVSVGDDEIVFLGGLDETSDSDSREGLFFMPSFLCGSRHENDRMEIILMLHVQRL